MRRYIKSIAQIICWKVKIICLKIQHGRNLQIKWNDRISMSVKIRINGTGKVSLGEKVELRENVILNVTDGGEIKVGDRVFINDGSFINARKLVSIGNDTMFGQSVKIYDHDHDYKSNDIKNKFKCSNVDVGQNVWICSDVIILQGCKIGNRSVIVAGTIVRESISNDTLFYTKREFGQKRIQLIRSE